MLVTVRPSFSMGQDNRLLLVGLEDQAFVSIHCFQCYHSPLRRVCMSRRFI